MVRRWFITRASCETRDVTLLFFQRVPPLRVEDLIDDLKDGTKLLALLEVLSGEKLVGVLKMYDLCDCGVFCSLWREAGSSGGPIS
jgi:hypothetical protein